MRGFAGKPPRLEDLRLEEWARRDSILHGLDARAKILSVFLVLVAISTTPPASPLAFLPAATLLAAGIGVAGLPLGELALRAAFILPFPLFFAVIGWLENGNAWFAAAIVVRSYLSALAVVLLMGVTPLPELLRGLRGLYVPAVLVMILQSLVRYLQVIIDHAMRMRRAALCRDGGAMPRNRRPSIWRRTSGSLAVLFARSYSRAEGVHRAMSARGFQGEFISPRPLQFRLRDWLCLAVAGIAVAAVSYAGRMAL